MWKSSIAVVSLITMFGAGASAQDVENGKKIFRKCAGCHQIGEKAKNGAGPVLTAVLGRAAADVDGFKYSKSMKAAGDAGLVWSEENIFEYIAGPKPFLREFLGDKKAKAAMRFRLKKEQDRLDVIAFLATFSPAVTEGVDATVEDSTEMMVVPAEEDAALTEDGLCVRNAAKHAHLFAVEATEGARKTAMLNPGETLCGGGQAGTTGVVSVYEHAEELEGCSRIVPIGKTEDLLKYVDFDRCFWSSNT